MRADADGFHDGTDFVGAREHDYVKAAIDLHQLLERFDAVQLRHQHVKNDEIGTLAGGYFLNGFSPGTHGFHFEAIYFQKCLQILANARLVINDENFLFRLPGSHSDSFLTL